MLEEAPDEFQGVKGDMAGAVAVSLAVGEGNVSIFESHDSGIAE